MSLVKILPEILSNKIAAGEVVERPASVVKELVENALDANSTQIHVEVENGGRSLIRVSDNGEGMAHDDALLAMERYATSKIYTDTDLFAIRTLGFRGEALPSIASVSRFELISKDRDSASGTQIRVEGGKIKNVVETGAPQGTMITVKNLFYNTPARRKFLKTVNTEMGHITDTLSQMAMGNPTVRFKLTHNNKVIYNWSKSPDAFGRVADVLGKALQKDLFDITFSQNGVAVSGWVASDRHTKSTNRGIYIFVNKRFVRDRVITHALFEGFSGRLMKGKYPTAALFITLPPDQVDVNVHPTKHEVRFADQRGVHAAVQTAVAQAFKSAPDIPWKTVATPLVEKDFEKPIETPPSLVSEKQRPASPRPALFSPPSFAPLKEEKDHIPSFPPAEIPKPQIKDQNTLWQKRFFSDLRIVGQIHNTYIICEFEDGFVLIDQHAAHERIMYEKLKARSANQTIPKQTLLMPEILELGFKETDILNELLPELAQVGWDIDPFGPETFAIKAVPSVLAESDVIPVITEIIDKMIEMGIKSDLETALEESRKIMACHSAVRASQALTDKHLTRLLEQLDQCENPSNCPHGRPTWIQYTKKDLEKQFKRIV